MYSAELDIKTPHTSASCLDFLLSIGMDGQLNTSIYCKRDYCNFHITNFLSLARNNPSSPAYGVLSLSFCHTPGLAPRMNVLFLKARRQATQTGIPHGTLEIVIQENLWLIRGSYSQCEVSLSRMLNKILTLDQLQWLPNRSDFPKISWP